MLCVLSLFSCVRLFLTLWTVAHQAFLSMEFSRQEYWSGSPVSSSGDLSDSGIELVSPTWQECSFPLSHWGNPIHSEMTEKILEWLKKKFSPSVQFSRSLVSDSLRPHESQHAKPPCPSPTPRVHPNSCAWSRWCHPVISSSVVPFSACPQSLPASGSFPVSQLFAWGGQNIGVSASASDLPKNTQGWSPSEWTGWISLQSKGLSRVFSNTTVQKHQRSALSPHYGPTLTSIHDYWKNHSFD